MTYNTDTGVGRKVYEIIKFVLTAISVAVIMVTVSQTKEMATLLWEYWTKTDKGYMWTINIIIAIIVGKMMIGRQKGKAAVVLKLLLMFCVTIISECLLWHRSDIWKKLVESEMIRHNIILVGGGIIAATIAFILHIKDIDYSDKPESEPESEQESEPEPESEPEFTPKSGKK